MVQEIKINLNMLKFMPKMIESEVDNLTNDYYSIKNSAYKLSSLWKGDNISILFGENNNYSVIGSEGQ